jgi:amino acid transporter
MNEEYKKDYHFGFIAMILSLVFILLAFLAYGIIMVISVATDFPNDVNPVAVISSIILLGIVSVLLISMMVNFMKSLKQKKHDNNTTNNMEGNIE